MTNMHTNIHTCVTQKDTHTYSHTYKVIRRHAYIQSYVDTHTYSHTYIYTKAQQINTQYQACTNSKHTTDWADALSANKLRYNTLLRLAKDAPRWTRAMGSAGFAADEDASQRLRLAMLLLGVSSGFVSIQDFPGESCLSVFRSVYVSVFPILASGGFMCKFFLISDVCLSARLSMLFYSYYG
jgi:hypothetical protein